MIYNNVSNLPDGVYQNKDYDLNKNKFYIRIENQNLDIKYLGELKNHPINPDIYDSPNYWPLLHRDVSLASSFLGYTVPTGSYKFIVSGNHIEVVKTQPTLHYNDYVEQSFYIMDEEINRIFQTHEEVIVPSGGGIDSLVLLSYITKKNLLHKVRILNQFNSISRTEKSLMFYETNKTAYKNFEKYFTPLIKEFRHDTLDSNDLLYVINNFDYEKLKCYSTTKMFLQYTNVGFLFGFGGNQTMLHHTPIIDIVLGASTIPNKKEVLHDLIQAKNYYSASPLTYRYDVNKKDFCTIDIFTYQYKPWNSFDGFNGNRMYFPIGSISHLARMLDYSTVDFETVLHAKMCKEIIARNVGDLFDPFIKITTPFDSDNFVNLTFNKSDIDPAALVIPQTLNQPPDKLKHLEDKIKSDTIDHFTISVIKMLQHMENLFGN